MTVDRDAIATDALLTDLYLDALLAGAVLDAAAAGASDLSDNGLDPAARRAADRLRRDLVRVHPSFRFEERLATRLAEAAVAMRLPVAAGEDGRIVAFRGAASNDPDPAADADTAADDAIAASLLGAPDTDAPGNATAGSGSSPASGRRTAARPLLIGGALTSAALSIAGAAFVAWRLGRPGRASTPMARAARAVREAHLVAGSGGRIMPIAAGRRSRRWD